MWRLLAKYCKTNSSIGALGRVFDFLLKGSACASGFLLLFIWGVVLTSILGRIFGFPAPQWEYQFTQYSLFWATLLVMAWLSRRQGHVSIDLLIEKLSPKHRFLMEVVQKTIGSIACLIVTFSSGWLCFRLYNSGVIEEDVVDIHKWIIVSIIPFTFFLFAIELIREGFVAVRKQYGP